MMLLSAISTSPLHPIFCQPTVLHQFRQGRGRSKCLPVRQVLLGQSPWRRHTLRINSSSSLAPLNWRCGCDLSFRRQSLELRRWFPIEQEMEQIWQRHWTWVPEWSSKCSSPSPCCSSPSLLVSSSRCRSASSPSCCCPSPNCDLPCELALSDSKPFSTPSWGKMKISPLHSVM